MKTISKILVLAVALGAMTFVSCRKGDDEKKVEEATFSKPANSQQAVVVTFNTGSPSNQVPASKLSESADDDFLPVVKDVEFTNSGYAKLGVVNAPKAVPTSTKAGVKGEEDVQYFIEKYTYNGGVYVIENFGSIKINGNSIEVTIDSETITVTATSVDDVPETTAGSLEYNLCRAWVLDRIVISVKGGQLGKNGFGVDKKASSYADGIISFKEIAKLLKDNNVNIPDEVELADYNIIDVNFTEFGSFIINFANADPFTGSFNLASDTFSYKLSGTQGNSIINGEANGSVSFEKVDGVNYGYLKVNGKIESGSDKYTSVVELTLKEK